MSTRGTWARIVLCVAMVAVPVAVHRVAAAAPRFAGRVATGSLHTCAIGTDDTVRCWGDNQVGQLGNAAFAQTGTESVSPVTVDALPGGRVARRIAAGANHTCVLADDGTVWCWGAGSSGQLGSGVFASEVSPIRALISGTAVDIGAGGSTTCAVIDDGSVECWGANSFGQVGKGTITTSESTPVTVQRTPFGGSHLNSFSAVAVEVSGTAACAISDQGSLWCWGDNRYGVVGTNSYVSYSQPTLVTAVGGTVTALSMGVDHACAMSGSDPVCWGRNTSAQVTTPYDSVQHLPTVMSFPGTTVSVHAAGDSTCAIDSSGSVNCRGRNASGQISSTINSRQTTVSQYVGAVNATEVDGSNGHVCATQSDGAVLCAGDNSVGQTGDPGTMLDKTTIPAAVSGIDVSPTTTTTTTITTTTTTTTLAPTTTTSEPPTTTSSTSSTSSSTTTSSTSSTTSTTVAPQTTSTTSTTTTTSAPPSAASTTAGAKAKSVVLRRGSRISARRVAAVVSLAVPKRSQGSMRISITRGSRSCRFVGSTIVGVRTGRCTITVVLMPRTGRPTVRHTTIVVS